MMRISRTVLVALVLFGLGGGNGLAQSAEDEGKPLYGNGLGFNIALTNSGFGIGAFWQRALSFHYTFISEFTMGAGKDSREQRFFNFWGESYIPGKANYLLMVPLQVGIQRRLFADDIQDNFRPFLQFSAGPTFGWVSPYFKDSNGNGVWDPDLNEKTYDSISAFPRGKGRMGAGSVVALGAHFGRSRKVTQSLRFGVSFIYFPDGIELMQKGIRESGPQEFFVSPVISLSFGRSRR